MVVAVRRQIHVACTIGELYKILRFPFNIYTMAKASDFKFGRRFGFAKPHHKITPTGKCGNSGVPLQYFGNS